MHFQLIENRFNKFISLNRESIKQTNIFQQIKTLKQQLKYQEIMYRNEIGDKIIKWFHNKSRLIPISNTNRVTTLDYIK